MINRNRPLLAASFLPFITLAALILVFILYRPSQASPDGTFNVNTVADTDDGSCNVAHCTLREAINAANNAAGADTITFTLPPSATITLNGTQLPVITGTLIIDGSTAVDLTISGGSLSRVFEIGSGTAVAITSLTLSDGASDSGSAISNDGGQLNVNNSTFIDNWAWKYLAGGGAIANWGGIVNISDSFFNANVAADMGGGVFNSNGIVNIRNSTFRVNRADWNFGGGANPVGGAISNQDGILNISNSTFSGNFCVGYHGGCFGGGIANSGTLNLDNTTFSGNVASAYPGPQGGGIYSYDGGILNFSNTIIANSIGGDCISGQISDNINNLVEDGSCSPAFTGDPLLGPLQDNGGPTWTHALSSISQAIDNGDNATCAAPPINNLDQRGVTRPLDGNGDGTSDCDIGAYEYDGPPPEKSFLPILRRE